MGSGSVTKKMRRIKSRNKKIGRIKKVIAAAKAAKPKTSSRSRA